jgi:mono/diheme cytochrome c family protein
MALSLGEIAFGAVVVAGLTLLAIGPPGGRGPAPPAIVEAASSQPGPAVTVVASAGITLHSVSVDLPASDRTFPGAGADAINNNCLACHSAGMVLNQPDLPRTLWQAEVEKMRGSYKAPVAEADVPAIVDYLAATKSKN